MIKKIKIIYELLFLGGMVLQTNMNEILARIEEQNKIQKSEVSRN